MAELTKITVPDIGNFAEVDVIDILVKVGDEVSVEDALITLESDKASMDIPAPTAGTVKDLHIKIGDKVKKGSLILSLATTDAAASSAVSTATKKQAPEALVSAPKKTEQTKTVAKNSRADHSCDVLVLGSGPGGYSAAFRAADLGKNVILVERYAAIGGVCLNVGCIPSKALLHTAKVITDAEEISQHGVSFNRPNIDLEKIKQWKNNDVVNKLTLGLGQMAKQRGVKVIQGYGEFSNTNQALVSTPDNKKLTVQFASCIIAAGSQPIKMPDAPDDPRIMDSTGALELHDIPTRLLVIGGGIIGLEMGTVYDALGSKVSIVELTDGLIQGCDRDIVRPLQKRMSQRFEAIMLNTKVTAMQATKAGISVTFSGENAPAPQVYDRVLVSVGRKPNGHLIKAENAGVHVDERGFIPVNKQMKTNVDHIYAIGDIVGQPMLAHKATHEGKIAAEVIAGEKVEFQAMTIPSVAYTDPEIAWAGITEEEAKAQNIDYEKAVFPWAASGRALSTSRTEGMTKLIFDKKNQRLIGAAIVGINAGELIAETVLAIEMGADAHDISLSIHPHPTLSESVAMAAEIKEGTITDLYIKKRTP